MYKLLQEIINGRSYDFTSFANILLLILVLDINECNDTSECANGTCVNNDGSFTCICDDGFMANLDQNACDGNVFILSGKLSNLSY